MNRSLVGPLLYSIITALLCAGCALEARIEPVSNSFLEDVDTSQKLDTLPFQHSWLRAGIERAKFKKLLFKPIRIDRLSENAWESSTSVVITSKESYLKEAQVLADYFRSELIAECRKIENPRFEITESPGPEVLTVEVALTELEFSRPITRAAALVSPIPGTDIALSTMSDPHVAFALHVSDPSGQLIATAADRKFPPTRIIDFNKLTVTSSAREVTALWASMLAKAFMKGTSDTIENQGSFSVLPW